MIDDKIEENKSNPVKFEKDIPELVTSIKITKNYALNFYKAS